MLAVARYMAGTGDTAFLDEAMWKPACWRRGKWVRFWSGCGPPEAVGAGSIGLTVYPVYPEGFFKNPQVRPFGYQNGGDWTWFGGRTIQHLVGLGARARGRRPPVIRRIPATSPPPAGSSSPCARTRGPRRGSPSR